MAEKTAATEAGLLSQPKDGFKYELVDGHAPDDALALDDVLPGFSCRVSDVFA